MQHFTAYYVKDRARPVREQSPKIAETLRKAGRTPWSMTEDNNFLIFKGTIDGENDSNTDS